MLLAFADGRFERSGGGDGFAQAAVHRDSLAILYFEAKSLRLAPVAAADEPELDSVCGDGPRDRYAVQAIDISREIVAEGEDCLHFFEAFVQARGFLEHHLFAETVTRAGDRVEQ